MYNDYVKLLNSLINSKQASLPLSLDYIGLTKTEEKYVVKYLLKELKHSDSDDGSISLLSLIDFYHNRGKLISLLNKLMAGNISSSLKAKLSKLADLIEKVDQIKNEEYNSLGTNAYSTISAPLNEEMTPELNKVYKNAEFAFNRTLDSKYLPTTTPTADTSKYDNMKREELVGLFSPEIFTKLSTAEKQQVMQAIVNEYCAANGVASCAVEFSPLTMNNKFICYGEYDPNKGKITINSLVIKKLESALASGNTELCYKLLETTIHEAHHRTQFHNLNEGKDLSPKKKLVCSSLLKGQSGLAHSEYLALPDELDSRNAALQYFRELTNSLPEKQAKEVYAQYVKSLEEERRSPKAEISEEYKKFFPEIYGKTQDLEFSEIEK